MSDSEPQSTSSEAPAPSETPDAPEYQPEPLPAEAHYVYHRSHDDSGVERR